MKFRSYEKCQDKKREISGKKVIGIDPAKEKHQAVVLNYAPPDTTLQNITVLLILFRRSGIDNNDNLIYH